MPATLKNSRPSSSPASIRRSRPRSAVDGAHRIERDAQFPREAIAGSAGNNSQRGVAKHQRRTDFVDGSVAAPRDDERRALPERSGGQLAAVARPFGHEYLALVAAASDQRRRELGAIARHVQPATGTEIGLMMTATRVDAKACGLLSTELRLPN